MFMALDCSVKVIAAQFDSNLTRPHLTVIPISRTKKATKQKIDSWSTCVHSLNYDLLQVRVSPEQAAKKKQTNHRSHGRIYNIDLPKCDVL
jgi:hypothetical protein